MFSRRIISYYFVFSMRVIERLTLTEYFREKFEEICDLNLTYFDQQDVGAKAYSAYSTEIYLNHDYFLTDERSQTAWMGTVTYSFVQFLVLVFEFEILLMEAYGLHKMPFVFWKNTVFIFEFKIL